LFNATSVFFENPKPGTNIMVEVACEIRNPNACSQDQTFFKAFLARDLARTAKIAPFMFNAIIPKLSASAAAAAKQVSNSFTPIPSILTFLQCNGTDSAVSCGQRWNQDTMDSNTGLGQQLSALDIVQALLAEKATQPLRAPSNSTGSSTPTTTITGALSPPTPTASSTISTIPTSAASTPQAGLYSLFAIFAVVSVSLF
jgi:mannan endo-1,6-alpha-mannosidase